MYQVFYGTQRFDGFQGQRGDILSQKLTNPYLEVLLLTIVANQIDKDYFRVAKIEAGHLDEKIPVS